MFSQQLQLSTTKMIKGLFSILGTSLIIIVDVSGVCHQRAPWQQSLRSHFRKASQQTDHSQCKLAVHPMANNQNQISLKLLINRFIMVFVNLIFIDFYLIVWDQNQSLLACWNLMFLCYRTIPICLNLYSLYLYRYVWYFYV